MKQIKLTVNECYNTEFYIEICYAKNVYGRLTAYCGGKKIEGCKVVGGCGYDKFGVMLSHVLNCLVGERLVCNAGEGEAYTIDEAAKHGIKIEKITLTKNGALYKFTNLNAKGV